jgi:hypothetical protein
MTWHFGTKKATAQDKFWKWFVKHEAELYDFEFDRERVFNQLASELQKIDSNLVFEFGPKRPQREFVISAGGIKSSFPAVVMLASAAPVLERWTVIAFRPRRTPISNIEIRGKRIDPEGVQFSLLDNGKVAGIYLFLPGFQEADVDLKQIGYLLLDEALGEYDVETGLGLIKMLSPDEPTNEDRYPLVELPELFDGLITRLEGRSRKPS